MKRDFERVKQSLKSAADRGDRQAGEALEAIVWLETTNTVTITIGMGPTKTGEFGDTYDNGNITINYMSGYKAEPGVFYAPVILGHELGHSWSKVNEFAFITRNQSAINGIIWGNIMRRAVGSRCAQGDDNWGTRIWPDMSGNCSAWPGRRY